MQRWRGYFWRFCIVGAIGFGVDAGLTLTLTQSAGWNSFSARIFAFLIAASLTWILNLRFTFRSTRGAGTWLPYVSLAVLGAGINVGTYLAWLHWAGGGPLQLLIGVAIGSACAMSFNFVAVGNLVFRS